MSIFFILHFIADFLLQSRDVAKNKSTSNKHLFIHLGIMFVVFALGGFLYFRLRFVDSSVYLLSQACFLALLNTIIHGLIDRNIWSLYKYKVGKSMLKNPDKVFFDSPAAHDMAHYALSQGDTKKFLTLASTSWQYWDDKWFYCTIGLDQLLHSLTILIIYNGL